jgi:hypothetical protein
MSRRAVEADIVIGQALDCGAGGAKREENRLPDAVGAGTGVVEGLDRRRVGGPLEGNVRPASGGESG